MSLVLHPRVRALTARERLVVIGAALAVFAFAAGPVWRHAWEPDAAILWSYAVIPAGVFLAFLRRGRPRLVPVLLESLLLSVVKFGVTAFVLVGLWSFGTPPVPPRAGGFLARVFGSESTRDSSGGRERGAGGGALRGTGALGSAAEKAALFTRLGAAQRVTVGDGGFSSKVIELTPEREVAFEAADGRLHTVQLLAPDGSIARNIPLLASGAPRFLSFEEISRFPSLRCAVHPEERADLIAVRR